MARTRLCHRRPHAPAVKPAPNAASAPAANLRPFRSFFESSKAPETVRWRRFRGLGFAPVFAVNRGFSHSRTGFEPAQKLHRGGAACICPAFARPAFANPGVLLERNHHPPLPAFVRPAPASPRPHSATIADFAIDLGAAKPEKPCDRGVFGAFCLLLKAERHRVLAAGWFVLFSAARAARFRFRPFFLAPCRRWRRGCGPAGRGRGRLVRGGRRRGRFGAVRRCRDSRGWQWPGRG